MSKSNAMNATAAAIQPISPPTHEEDPLLTISEVGRQLGKSHTTIARWVQDGLMLAVMQPGGRLSIRKSVVNQFLGGSALNKKVS